MSGFLQKTPALRVVLRNDLLRKRYPSSGSLMAVVDTGYEGFVSVSQDIFRELALEALQSAERELALANGRTINSTVAYGTIELPEGRFSADGPFETYDGSSEVLLGCEYLSRFKLELDYCTASLTAEPCR